MHIWQRTLTIAATLSILITALWLSGCAAVNPEPVEIQTVANLVVVSDRLVTSGRLAPAQLKELDPQQYRLVINLDPNDTETGLQNEVSLLTSNGIAYVAIPVLSDNPKYRDFLLFSSILNGTPEGRVWVHCRLNYRASIFTFLYRVIHQGADPDSAYEKVTQVWLPTPAWLKFAQETLARHQIEFDFIY